MKRTMLVLLGTVMVLSPARAQTPDERRASVEYLRGLQTTDGGFRATKPRTAEEEKKAPPSLRATSSALRALRYFGGEARDPEACARFVERCFDRKAGSFADQPGGKDDVFTTAVGLMAVIELKLPVDTYAGPVARYLGANARSFDDIRIAAAGLERIEKKPEQAAGWLEQVLKLRNADGTYGKGNGIARDTGGASVTVLRLGGKIDKDRVLRTLNQGQRGDGGFGKEGTDGSDLETSYRVMRAYHMLKAKPEKDDRLRGFVSRCRNADGGYGMAPGQPSGVSGTYFASIILHWLAEK